MSADPMPTDATSADTIFLGGDIITMDENNPTAEALAVKDGKIIAVGKLDEILPKLAGQKTTVVNLNKQTLMPGFIEPHQHAVQMALMSNLHVNVSGYDHTSYDEVNAKMKTTIAEVDPSTQTKSWCIFFGWDPELLPDLPILTADFLDQEFTTEIPILVLGQSGHVAWANHKALELARVDEHTPDVDGGVFVKDEDGKLTGQLFETPAIGKVYLAAPQPSDEDISLAVQEQWKDYAKRGFTTVTDLAYSETEGCNKALNEKSNMADCPVRVALYQFKTPRRNQKSKQKTMCCNMVFKSPETSVKTKLEENDKLWVQGYKIIADGSPHCGTMAVREPFLRSNLAEILCFPPVPDSYGHQNYSWDEMYEMVTKYHEEGKQVSVHAHGERAIERVISVFEKVLESDNENSHRHRMEHLGLMTEDQIIRAGKSNLTLSFFVAHLYFYAKTFSEYIFGRERTDRWTPLSLATKHNIRWSLHQDHPAFPGQPQPFECMRTAVTRTRKGDDETVYGKEYRVSIHEALKAYTISAAWQLNRDKELGSLEKDKRADLVILSDNPYKVNPLELHKIKVVDTFIDGRSNNVSISKHPNGKRHLMYSIN